MMNAEYALPTNLTQFCPQNCDIWSGKEFFDQLKRRNDLAEARITTDFYSQPPCAYVVYGCKNKVMWLFVHPDNSNLRLVQEVVLYNDRYLPLTTCTFSRSSKRPLVLAGNSEGQLFLVDLSYGPGQAKVLTSSTPPVNAFNDSSKLHVGNRVQSSCWIDADNVVCALSNQILHLNISGQCFNNIAIDSFSTKDTNNNRLEKIDLPKEITCLSISKQDPFLLGKNRVFISLP